MNTAALDGSTQHLGGGCLQAPVLIRYDQLDAPQAAIRQRAQEFVPEYLGLAGLDGDAQNLASPVSVDPLPGR